MLITPHHAQYQHDQCFRYYVGALLFQLQEAGSEVNYSTTRLVRGLSSTRKWARLGFATAFTQVGQLRQTCTKYIANTVSLLLFAGINVCVFDTQPSSRGLL